jgi:hypothetical protein
MQFDVPSQKPAGAEPAGELKAVLERLDMVTKELAELKTGKTQETEASIKAKQAQEEQGIKSYLKAIAEKNKDKFEISARPENLDEAIAKALAKAPDAVAALGIDPATLDKLPPDQAEALAAKALELAEQEFEQLGKRFGKATKPERVRAYDVPLSKPRIDFGKKPEKESFEQMKERYKAKYDNLFGTGATYQSTPDSRGAGIVK